MRDMSLTRRRFFSVGAGSLGAAALLAAGAETTAAADSGQAVKMYVFRGETGVKGPDGKGHDAFVPSDFAAKVGVPVQLSIINYDEGPHTITAPDLGVNIMINPGNAVGEDVKPVTTNATFTPTKAGVFRWYCATDCDGGGGHWAMSKGWDGPDQDRFMAGRIVVLAANAAAAPAQAPAQVPAALPKTGGGGLSRLPSALGLVPLAAVLAGIAYKFRGGRSSDTEEK